MREAETQHNPARNQPVSPQGKGAVLESSQGEQIAQLEAMAEASSQVGKLTQLVAKANNSSQAVAQRGLLAEIHNSPHSTEQRQQLDSMTGETAQREEAQPNPSNTGLPDSLKSGIESLSGISMDNVKVHYNSSQPAQLNAHAYAQGTDIHVAPRQEQHLPHEAWHVVQQAQGRVQPTTQMKGGAGLIGKEPGQPFVKPPGFGVLQRVISVNAEELTTQQVKRYLEEHGILPLNMAEYPEVVAEVETSGKSFGSWDDLIQELIHRCRGKDLLASMGEVGGEGVVWGAKSIPRLKHIGMEKRKPFTSWLFHRGPPPTAMNCWEAVLYAASKFGAVSKGEIAEYIAEVENVTVMGEAMVPIFIKRILDNATGKIENFSGAPMELGDLSIPLGYVVIFGEDGQHVALSAGGNRVMELDADTGGVVVTPIAEVMAKKAAYGRHLAWGPLPV